MSYEYRVIGVDPGINCTGYGIVSRIDSCFKFLHDGVITTSSHLPQGVGFPTKLQKIYNDLSEIIRNWKPNAIAIEETIFVRNVKTALALGQVQGVIILAGVNSGLEIFEYSPKKVKISVAGNGSATKEQMKYMVEQLLNLTCRQRAGGYPSSLDSSDALGVAICHLNQI